MSGSQPIEKVAQTLPHCDLPMPHHMPEINVEMDPAQLSIQMCDMDDCQCEHVNTAEVPEERDSFTTLLTGWSMSLIATVPDATIPFIPSNDRPPRFMHA